MSDPTDGNGHEQHDRDDHPDLTRVAGEMRAAWRAEQEAAAADAAEQWRHGRALADWLRERMHAGDRIAAFVASQRFEGTVDDVGDDLVALRGPIGRVEIHVCPAVPVSFELVEHATHGGKRAPHPLAFRDALLARDAQSGVRVGTLQQPEGIDGTLFVALDHVSIAARSGVETIVPIAHVAWVVATRE